MAKRLDELFAEFPSPPIPAMEDWDPVDPDALWVDYDDDIDDLIIYFSESHRGGVHVHVNNGFYVVVHSKDNRPIGLHFEHWERNFVPRDAGLARMWHELRPLDTGPNSEVLRAFAAAVCLRLAYLSSTGQALPYAVPA